jgi:hypothetical protein
MLFLSAKAIGGLFRPWELGTKSIPIHLFNWAVAARVVPTVNSHQTKWSFFKDRRGEHVRGTPPPPCPAKSLQILGEIVHVKLLCG